MRQCLTAGIAYDRLCLRRRSRPSYVTGGPDQIGFATADPATRRTVDDGEDLSQVVRTGYEDLAFCALEVEDEARVARAFTLQKRFAVGLDEALSSMLELGIAQLEGRDFPAAEATLRGLLRESPEHAPAHHNLAAVLLGTGQLDSAATHLRAALQTQVDPLTSYTLAQVLLRRGELEEARTLLFEVLPGAGPISHRRLELEAQYGGLRVAEVAHSFELLGQIRHEWRDYAGAAHAYRAAIAIHDSDAAEARAQLEINLDLDRQRADAAAPP